MTPRTGRLPEAAHGPPNRGILLTPFHNMALMCPQTTVDDVARHHEHPAAWQLLIH